MGDHALTHLVAVDVGQIRDLQIEVRRRGEQLVLVTEVAHHHRRIDVRVGRDGPDGGSFVPRLGEPLLGRGQDHRLRFR